MATRACYPVEVKMKAIKMRLAGIPVKIVMEELNIKSYSQPKNWMKWHWEDVHHRLHQPIGN